MAYDLRISDWSSDVCSSDLEPLAPPDIDALIDSYAALGLDSIFLRPINFQGFARKRHRGSREQDDRWRAYYERFVHRLIERNWVDRAHVLEELYLSICLRRFIQPARDRLVDNIGRASRRERVLYNVCVLECADSLYQKNIKILST